MSPSKDKGKATTEKGMLTLLLGGAPSAAADEHLLLTVQPPCCASLSFRCEPGICKRSNLWNGICGTFMLSLYQTRRWLPAIEMVLKPHIKHEGLLAFLGAQNMCTLTSLSSCAAFVSCWFSSWRSSFTFVAWDCTCWRSASSSFSRSANCFLSSASGSFPLLVQLFTPPP